MRKCQLDIEKSREVYESFKDYIKVKECYNNVYNVFELNLDFFREGKLKVAYGYVEVMAGLYCRHCFILDESGKVIDPTIFVQSEQRLQREYYVMAVFDDVDEYLTAIMDDDCMPALDRYFRERDKKAQEWAIDNGVIFVG